MFLIQSRVRNVFATNEMSDDLEEPGLPKQSSNPPTPSLESDSPDGGFQAWATVLGWYAIFQVVSAILGFTMVFSFLMQFCAFGQVLAPFFCYTSVNRTITDT